MRVALTLVARAPMSPPGLRLLHDVALGLFFVHEQHHTTHLDLKSPNVLIHGPPRPPTPIAVT